MMTMHNEMLVQAIEADRRREERALERLRALPRDGGTGTAEDGPWTKARRALGHRLIALGLRVAAVHPSSARSVATGSPR